MTAPTPESKLAALVVQIRELVERAQAARTAEARALAEGAKEKT